MPEPDEKTTVIAHHMTGERVRWNEDEEVGRPSRRRERRPQSRSRPSDSLSIHRASSRNRGDPALALPVTYRTV